MKFCQNCGVFRLAGTFETQAATSQCQNHSENSERVLLAVAVVHQDIPRMLAPSSVQATSLCSFLRGPGCSCCPYFLANHTMPKLAMLSYSPENTPNDCLYQPCSGANPTEVGRQAVLTRWAQWGTFLRLSQDLGIAGRAQHKLRRALARRKVAVQPHKPAILIGAEGGVPDL